MPTPNEQLNAVLKDANVSRTVYAYTMQDGQNLLDEVLDGGRAYDIIVGGLKDSFTRGTDRTIADIAHGLVAALKEARRPYHDMHTEAWTQKQDLAHYEFFDTWSKWSSPVVALDRAEFKYVYPTAGASEGLRATIQGYGCDARFEKFEPTIHVFEGEYEGYGAFAGAAHIPLKAHPRDRWPDAIAQVGPHDQFYVSQPSAIDGNVWDEFEDFATALEKAQPTAKLMLDVTYVGAVARPFAVNANHPNISKVFLSLSKPFGTYYHRIGGCLAREEDMSLFGNKWFKHMEALKFGTALMNRFDVHALPGRYAGVQARAAAEANAKLGLDLKLCDVFLLASARPTAQPTDLENYLTRPNGANPIVRVCLTPTMAHIVNPNLSQKVISRAHEILPGVKP